MVTLQMPSGADWDYPSGFDLATSTDGVNWTTVATGGRLRLEAADRY